MKYIRFFENLRLQDVPEVGGKNAALGQMIAGLKDQGILVPDGFATTAQAYWHFINSNQLLPRMQAAMTLLKNPADVAALRTVGHQIRELIKEVPIPADLQQELSAAYHELSHRSQQAACTVAVRSSATAEDLPTASFAGQQETYLNVQGTQELLIAWRNCVASLFTDRAIAYRIEKGFDHWKVALSVGIQKMIRSDLAVSGVAFSLDTETGFKEVVLINAAYGLGESIVQGQVIPDEYIVYKPMLEKGFTPIIKKQLGDKKKKLVYAQKGASTKSIEVAQEEQRHFALSDQEIIALARMIMTIESYYSQQQQKWVPVDVEWAKDGTDGKMYIIQARPETVHSSKPIEQPMLTHYSLPDKPSVSLLTGQSIGQQIVSGRVNIVHSIQESEKIEHGDILVTSMTDPDWVPVMKKVAGIITDQGGRTCHAAIVARELNIPALVGTFTGTTTLKNGQEITLDCCQGATGYVYEGILQPVVHKIALTKIPKLPTQLLINTANPATAFSVSRLPVNGVGLLRIEFIMSNMIKIHPMALLYPEKVQDKEVLKTIEQLTAAYASKQGYFIELLAQGIGMIAAAFYPRPVIVRFSDLKSNEYKQLLGGSFFELAEENPMLGFRGASRYYDTAYQAAFALECAAIKRVRETMGLSNVKVMVPFVRTVQEAQQVIELMKTYGLERGKNSLEVIMMCELPANVILIEDFAPLFDGFSIGSNDLTQLVLGVDRDNARLSALFDERDPAVVTMLVQAIKGAHRAQKPIGICGQAPSDYPELANLLMKEGIDSISLNTDSVVQFFDKEN